MDPIRDGYDALGISPDKLSGHCIGIAESTTQPFKRPPIEDGKLIAFMPFKLGVHAIRSFEDEANRATDEVSHLRDMLESEED